jgi:hypothetical protein
VEPTPIFPRKTLTNPCRKSNAFHETPFLSLSYVHRRHPSLPVAAQIFVEKAFYVDQAILDYARDWLTINQVELE